MIVDEMPEGKEFDLSERMGVIVDGTDVVLMNKVSGLGTLLTMEEAKAFQAAEL